MGDGYGHPEAATNRRDLLQACLIEGGNKRGMRTHVNGGAILERVNAGNLTRSSARFLERICFNLIIRNYWLGSTENLESITGTSPDQRKKAIKKLKETNNIKVIKSPSKVGNIWLLKVCPQVAWRGFGDKPGDNPIRLAMGHQWLLDGPGLRTGA